MKFPPRQPGRKADTERAAGIPDREPVTDSRDDVPLDLRSHGGRNWIIEPRLGYTSCRLRNVATNEVVVVGTLKQVLRFLSRHTPHRLGFRNLDP